MKRWIVFLVLGLIVSGHAEDQKEFNPETLPPEVFLQYVRRPFMECVWGAANGRISYRHPDGRGTVDLQLRMQFSATEMRIKTVLGKNDVYEMIQKHDDGADISLLTPPDAQEVTLEQLGIRPEDFALSFLHWNFREEKKPEFMRGQYCRVMTLAHPDQNQSVIVWFVAKYLFPLRVEWYKEQAAEPWRVLEFTDFKKHNDEFWFLKALKVYGHQWRTKVLFDDVELSYASQRPVPENLFDTAADIDSFLDGTREAAAPVDIDSDE